MIGDILVCTLVTALVAAVITYKVKEARKARKEGRCSTCSCCSGGTGCAKRAYQFESSDGEDAGQNCCCCGQENKED